MLDQAEIHRMARSEDVEERKRALLELIKTFSTLKDKEQAWDDLHRLTQDNDDIVRSGAALVLDGCYFQIPNEYKKQAWDDLHRLMQDKDVVVRRSAAESLDGCYSYMPEAYKKQAWGDIIRLMQDKDEVVRRLVTFALGACYSHIPEEYKKQVWDDLQRLTQYKDTNVRILANHSSGRVSIYRATKAKDDESFRKELETALRFFEKASNESTLFNPAKFCLPFYRSFYTMTFRKEGAEAEVKQYLAEAKSAVGGSKSKEKLLEVVENLGNALKDAQKAQDLNARITVLNECRRYIDRACELLDTTAEKAPGASRLIRRGLPIIDERIKGIITEIQEKAKTLCGETKNTPFRDAGIELNRIVQDFSQIRDPIGLEKSVYNMQTVLSAICAKLAEEERGEACTLLRQAKEEPYIEDKINVTIRPSIYYFL